MLTYTMDVLPESIWLRTTPGASAMGQPYVCTEAGQYLAQGHFSTARTHKETFDVSPYVSYAKEYAVSIGLSLDITATECWDNPISANPNRSGIKSDIESRLNRYKNSEGFTAVWIWTEKLSDTDYNIYIGYC